jgi:hypothetical protein
MDTEKKNELRNWEKNLVVALSGMDTLRGKRGMKRILRRYRSNIEVLGQIAALLLTGKGAARDLWKQKLQSVLQRAEDNPSLLSR